MDFGFLTPFTPIFMILGFLVILVSMLKWLSARSRGDYHSAFPFLPIVAGIMVGGTTIFIPAMAGLVKDVFSIASGEPSDAEPTEEPTSSPAPSAEPSQTPETSRPIDFGTIENIGTLWFILAVVVVTILIGVIGFLGWRAGRKEIARRAEAKAITAEFSERWDAVKELHQTMLRKITQAETDWDTLFFLPSLSDITVPETKALYEAFRAAGDVSDTIPREPTDDLASLPYPKAVYAFRNAWNVAEVAARKIGQSGLTREERKTIKEIKSLLAVAESSSAATTEREIAYRRIQSLVKTLTHIALPTAALEAIESGLTRVRAIEAPVETEKAAIAL